jgi:hypothetical protein
VVLRGRHLAQDFGANAGPFGRSSPLRGHWAVYDNLRMHRRQPGTGSRLGDEIATDVTREQPAFGDDQTGERVGADRHVAANHHSGLVRGRAQGHVAVSYYNARRAKSAHPLEKVKIRFGSANSRLLARRVNAWKSLSYRSCSHY